MANVGEFANSVRQLRYCRYSAQLFEIAGLPTAINGFLGRIVEADENDVRLVGHSRVSVFGLTLGAVGPK